VPLKSSINDDRLPGRCLGWLFSSDFPILLAQKRTAKSAVETAAAVEIGNGALRHLFLDDFHKLLGKAFAKKLASAFPQLPQRRRRRLVPKKPKRRNTTFLLLPQEQ
jgi:hypothetical protein